LSPAAMIHNLYKKKETAEILRITTKALENLVINGEIDSTLIGKRRMFLEYQIKSYQERNATANFK